MFMEQSQCDFMDSINEELTAILGDDFPNTFFQGSNSSSSSEFLTTIQRSSSAASLSAEPPQAVIEPPCKQRKINRDWSPSSAPIILNFGNTNSTDQNNLPQKGPPLNSDEDAAVSDVLTCQSSEPAKKISRVRPPSQTYDHIVAERKRRELLSQRFATLSAMVPGLTKMDKTSVLRDAINYLKELQERVRTLEEQATTQTMESMVLVKKSQMMMMEEDDNAGSSNQKDDPLPEIEARVCNNQILLRIQCEKVKGILVKLLAHVDNLNLTIVTTNVVTFGNIALDITIIAEMEKDQSSLSVKQIVKVLHSALQRAA
ncbi:hypothetical protein BUALT_Bualt04G0094600 [Buddleja alternifolia]|uniref:BHLH domain-containing protein n=1 Tax=Buddleja alternifolia TaxID=168488 RepID=A0AAV6XNZ6_9LAMI|nr:hypothetical protein BUALT_Bualt04G0094600 [Buddleja alternifolia]